MKILFLRLASFFNTKSAHPENTMMPIDIAIMISMAKELNVKFELLDTEATEYTHDQLISQINVFSPDYVFVKSKTSCLDNLLSIAKQISNIPFIGFGQAFVMNHEKYFFQNSPFIASIQGEPEIIFKNILKILLSKQSINNIEGITYKKNNIIITNPKTYTLNDLDELPIPSYDLFIKNEYHSFYPTPLFTRKKMGFMLSSRGCPYSCIFCSPTLRNSEGKKYRFHSTSRIISEMKILENLGVTIIQFRDDIFTYDRNRIVSLCKTLITNNNKVKWIIQTHLNNLDQELLTLMSNAGCISIGIGIESGSQKVLKKLSKNNDIQKAPEIFHHCRKVGIKTVAFFLLGSPTESQEDLNLTYQLFKKLDPDLIQVAFFTPYQGSKAYELLNTKTIESLHHYNNTNAFGNVDANDLKKFQKKLYLETLFSWPNFARISLRLLTDLFFNPRITLKFIVKASAYLCK